MAVVSDSTEYAVSWFGGHERGRLGHFWRDSLYERQRWYLWTRFLCWLGFFLKLKCAVSISCMYVSTIEVTVLLKSQFEWLLQFRFNVTIWFEILWYYHGWYWHWIVGIYWWMWMVAAIYRRTQSPSQLVWSEGLWPPGAQSAFIKWTGWTLAVTMVMRTAP